MDDFERRNYIVKSLSRTKRKDFENYVINRIWHKIDNIEIKLVTQQYVKRADGKYALLDMYFPQINTGIECDEAYHKDNTEPDKIREANLEESLCALNIGKDFTLIRVNANTDIIEFNSQIENAVAIIRKLYDENGSPKWSNEPDPVESVINKGTISLTDNLYFNKITEIALLFGKTYKAMQRCTFKTEEEIWVWCPKLAVKTNSGIKAPSSAGWLNLLSEDWNTITEVIPDGKSMNNSSSIFRNKRIVFAQSRNSLGKTAYRFIGVFKFEKQNIGANENIYVRVSDKYVLPKHTKYYCWNNSAIGKFDVFMMADKCMVERIVKHYHDPEAQSCRSMINNGGYYFLNTQEKIIVPMPELSFAFGGQYNDCPPYSSEIEDFDFSLDEYTLKTFDLKI